MGNVKTVSSHTFLQCGNRNSKKLHISLLCGPQEEHLQVLASSTELTVQIIWTAV